MPRVSVIVPAHNAATFVGRAIESVRAQTYGDWELVVVDDGSGDETWRVLQDAERALRDGGRTLRDGGRALRDAGARMLVLRREQAGGPAVARNLAIEHATGELMAFLDADDELLPRYLESQLACYEAACSEVAGRSEGRDVGGGDAEGADAEGGDVGGADVGGADVGGTGAATVGLVACDARIAIDGREAPYTHLQIVPGGRAPITLERVLRGNPLHVACLVPRAVGDQVGWFDPQLFGTEDFGLWIKILERGHRAVLNDEALAVYHRAPGSVSSNLARQGANNRRTYELALARGRLTPRQRRIARRAIRYNRAMEEVARMRFAGAHGSESRREGRAPAHGARRGGEMARLRTLPLLAWVALTNPRRWGEWARLLRTGTAKDAAKLSGA